MTKEQLRAIYLKRRAQIKQRPQADKEISAQLFDAPFYASAKTVMTYLSYKSEPDTLGIVSRMLADGKTVCAPVCFGNGRMEAYAFEDAGVLMPSSLGILEPPKQRRISPAEIDLNIVPGCCFNGKGYRIGYGGGYYDRYLQNFRGVTCGLFYDCLKTEFLAEKTDIPLHYIITEKRCYAFSTAL